MGNSPLGKINWNDLLNGLIFTILTQVLLYVQDAFSSAIAIDWNELGRIALTSFIGYLLLKLGVNSEGKFGVGEPLKNDVA